MYTCDHCHTDVGLPDNLIRVWFEDRGKKHAILVCWDCYWQDGEEGTYYQDAEADRTWEYGKTISID